MGDGVSVALVSRSPQRAYAQPLSRPPFSLSADMENGAVTLVGACIWAFASVGTVYRVSESSDYAYAGTHTVTTLMFRAHIAEIVSATVYSVITAMLVAISRFDSELLRCGEVAATAAAGECSPVLIWLATWFAVGAELTRFMALALRTPWTSAIQMATSICALLFHAALMGISASWFLLPAILAALSQFVAVGVSSVLILIDTAYRTHPINHAVIATAPAAKSRRPVL